jgi:tetratricopeptide (TPR) repeat protein
MMRRSGHFLAFSVFLLVFFAAIFPVTAEQPDPPQAGFDWARLTDEQLAAFRDLPGKEQENRAGQAEKLTEKVDQLPGAPEQLLLLREAVALDPAQPSHWLQLAELCRTMGYRHAATDALTSARSLFKEARGQHRKDCIRDYSLTLGWLEYEAGRWAETEAWGGKAREAGAGLHGSLLELLGMAASPLRYYEFDLKVAVFRPMDNDSNNRRSNAGWAWRQYQHLHKMSFDQGLWENCERRETRLDENNVLRWRDSGNVCEYNGRGEWADCYYRKSYEAIKGKAGGWLVEHEGGIPGFLPEMEPLPFWTNQDGYFVTGSPAAYAEYAYAMMNDSAQTARRAFWAEQLIYTATASTHRYPDWPWIYLWRGAAYLALDKVSDALGELQTGREQFEFANRPVDPRLDPLEGHIYLLLKKFNRAKPLLEKGVENFPRNAQCWSDLGIIRAAEGDLTGARQAFDMALSLDRGLAVAWHNRGFLNLKEGEWETALVDLQTAADLAPHDEQLIHDLQRVRDKVNRDRVSH